MITKYEAEVLTGMGEFISENGLHVQMCAYLVERLGCTPTQIAIALNSAAVAAGNTNPRITAGDCTP